MSPQVLRSWFGLVWFYGISNIEGYLMPIPELIFFTQLNGFTYFYLIKIILLTINHLFAHSLMFSSIAMYY